MQAVAKGALSVSNDQQCLCSARLFECLTKCVDLDDMSLMWKGICANLTRTFHNFGAEEAAKKVVSLSSTLTSHPSVQSCCIALLSFPGRAVPPSLRFHILTCLDRNKTCGPWHVSLVYQSVSLSELCPCACLHARIFTV